MYYGFNPCALQQCSRAPPRPQDTQRVKSMQRSGTEAISTQLQPSKPEWEIINITNSQNTKRTNGQPSEQLFPKRWPLSNRNGHRRGSCLHLEVSCKPVSANPDQTLPVLTGLRRGSYRLEECPYSPSLQERRQTSTFKLSPCIPDVYCL